MLFQADESGGHWGKKGGLLVLWPGSARIDDDDDVFEEFPIYRNL